MARIIEVRDALKARIEELWPVEDRASADDEVLAPLVFRLKAETTKGRKVFILASAYVKEIASRSSDRCDYTYVILVSERYRGQGHPPDEWITERISFCEWLIDSIGDARGPRLLNSLWPERSAITAVLDYDEMVERKLFGAAMEITYREIT